MSMSMSMSMSIDRESDLEHNKIEFQTLFWGAIEKSYHLNGRESGGIARHHIDSYNKFIKEGIPKIIEGHKLLIKLEEGHKEGLGTWTVEFDNVKMEHPTYTEANDYKHKITPIECTWRDITYSAPLYADMRVSFVNQTPEESAEESESIHKTYESVHLAMIPVMVGSCLCNIENMTKQELADNNEDIYDNGGYFVLNGSRKVLISQDQEATNNLVIYKSSKATNNFIYYAQIKSSSENTIHMTKTKIGYIENLGLAVLIPYIPDKTFIPLGILLKALGVETDKEVFDVIIRNITDDIIKNKQIRHIVERTLENSYGCKSQEEALLYIGKYWKRYNASGLGSEEIKSEDSKNYAMYLLTKEFLPHIDETAFESGNTFSEKIGYVSYVVSRLFGVILYPEQLLSDRDNFMNKRILVSGAIMNLQFDAAFKKLCKDVERTVINTYKKKTGSMTIISLFKPNTITNMMYSSLLTNNWDKFCQLNDGVSQMFEQANYVNGITNLTKVRTEIKVDGRRIIGPRKIISSLWGAYCVTGDTMILMSDNTTRPIKYLQDGDKVMTVDSNLNMIPSTIFNWFEKTPEQELYQITTLLGVVKCTHDHPFLVLDSSNGIVQYIWVEAQYLKEGMYVMFDIYDAIVKATGDSRNTRIYVGTGPTEVGSNADDENKIKLSQKISPIVILDVNRVDKEVVYDFTTESENHNFIANGFVTHNCLSETPEGKNVGLTKHLAFMCRITVGEHPSYITNIIQSNPDVFVSKLEGSTQDNFAIVVVNGRLIGYVRDAPKVVQYLRRLRRNGHINFETSISHYKFTPKNIADPVLNEVYIWTDKGRTTRPLVIVDNGEINCAPFLKQDYTFTDLLLSNTVEYIDKSEEENVYICQSMEDFMNSDDETRKKYTHIEFHPSVILGVSASIIPYANHAPSPRITYGAAMMKQAAGLPFVNWRRQYKGTYNILNYPQKPLCITKNAKIIGYDKLPAGQNAIVAITPDEFNQEDSVIINKAAIDRGFGTITRVYNFDCSIHYDKNERFAIPYPNVVSNSGKYKCSADRMREILDENGIVKKGTIVRDGDILIGKISTIRTKSDQRNESVSESVVYEHAFNGRVDSVKTGLNGDGYKYVKVCITQYREIDEGDKVASITAQKGTCGKVRNQEDMPFSSVTGTIPDILFNPLAIPSRMTINYLISAITGKTVCASSILNKVDVSQLFQQKKIFSGGSVDSTSFDHSDKIMKQVFSELKQYGFNQYGNEYMIDGKTGIAQKCLTYTGVVYYQRLKHMLVDKIHARSRGVRTALTHQPSEGRANGGGLRLGVMERDNLHVQGGVNLFRDRFLDNSDRYEAWICGGLDYEGEGTVKGCGFLAVVDESRSDTSSVMICQNCNRSDTLRKIVMPYATKLLNQELMAMNIGVRMLTQ